MHKSTCWSSEVMSGASRWPVRNEALSWLADSATKEDEDSESWEIFPARVKPRKDTVCQRRVFKTTM